MNHPVFNDIVNSFKNVVGNLGYDILLFSNKSFSNGGQDYLKRCVHFQLDGCLVIAGDEIEEATRELDRSNIPCVGIDIELTGPNSSYVTTDNEKVSESVVTHLYLNSIREVAFIGGPENSFVSGIRKDSFLKHMASFGMQVEEDWIQHGDYFEESGYHAMKNILRAKQKPQAVYAVSDMMALGALRAMKEAEVRVPEDMKLIGCDDIEACRYSDPTLATVKQDKEKMGRLAAVMLHDLINETAQPHAMKVDPELIVRASCAFDTAQVDKEEK
ncbi:substrate-binding domain-containing protein [Virgibacillus halophilus]|uniref:Substrate-binding domain-containing protein n=2 Tax=Tigheibacillus halophilus TaxID=361280 RepID=A0ABU5C4C0_9BACI|nr:substrate-binding domain-containing protein [Virgibacillus halophilus]